MKRQIKGSRINWIFFFRNSSDCCQRYYSDSVFTKLSKFFGEMSDVPVAVSEDQEASLSPLQVPPPDEVVDGNHGEDAQVQPRNPEQQAAATAGDRIHEEEIITSSQPSDEPQPRGHPDINQVRPLTNYFLFA